MSYSVYQAPNAFGPPTSGGGPLVPEQGFASFTPGAQVAVVAGVVALFGLFGFLVYKRVQLTHSIVKQHGVGKALAFEGGMAAIGALSRQV